MGRSGRVGDTLTAQHRSRRSILILYPRYSASRCGGWLLIFDLTERLAVGRSPHWCNSIAGCLFPLTREALVGTSDSVKAFGSCGIVRLPYPSRQPVDVRSREEIVGSNFSREISRHARAIPRSTGLLLHRATIGVGGRPAHTFHLGLTRRRVEGSRGSK